jgi:hypothetical protein
MTDEISNELQAEAVALVKQYKIWLPTPIRKFLIKLSDAVGWAQLYEVLR